VRFSPVDLPSVPASSVQLAAGTPLRDYLGITNRAERILAFVRFDSDVPIALGTAQGIVKRIVPTTLPVRPDLEVIGMKPGDAVVGAAEAPDDSELVFVTTDAQLLRFSASAVRPQGAAAGGMAGIKLGSGASVLFFSAVTADTDAVVATVSGAESILPGTDAGRAKVTPFTEYPAKGRATGGVRAHSFLKGEDRLSVAWVGPAPAQAVDPTGAVRKLPESGARRDASGQPVDAVIGSIGRTLI
ncbi:MAG: DNA gyrase C-terminal beta-propeller domain-containing protein, partial [Microbacterium sp.]|uniref:DNA gyrase C-terminal beta-propeller domain-containing protein n=1 Tax=Microbacterium sp. TaxID=51671 RepID=UPI003BAE37C3